MLSEPTAILIPRASRLPPGHPILQGFQDTNWIAGAQNRVPLKPVDAPLLTVVPGFVRYPPELAYPPHPHTTEPALVLRESGASRTAWFPGDLERTYWLTGHGDILRLLLNTIRWVSHDESVVHVDGPGFIEMFCWETSPGYAVHLLNYTNANAQHGWLRSVNPLGPQKVSMKLPSGVDVKSVELLKAGQSPSFVFHNQICSSPSLLWKTMKSQLSRADNRENRLVGSVSRLAMPVMLWPMISVWMSWVPS